MNFSQLFSNPKPIIGMIHLLPLPGTPNYDGNIKKIYEQAELEASILAQYGVDGMIVENFGDEPYLIGEPTPDQLALFAAVTYQIRREVSIPLGVNVQFNAWKAEIAIAKVTFADFVRVEVFVDTVNSAQGIVHPCSAQILRYRHLLMASHVLIFADIQTKYTTNLIPQSLTQSASDAKAAGADTLIITGAATGKTTPLDAVKEVKQTVNLPIFVGSGTTIQNVNEVLSIADGAIVGSAFKEGGVANNPVSSQKTSEFMDIVKEIRDKNVTIK